MQCNRYSLSVCYMPGTVLGVQHKWGEQAAFPAHVAPVGKNAGRDNSDSVPVHDNHIHTDSGSYYLVCP